MFTFRYNKSTQALEQPERASHRGACTNCRSRKLRCSGDRSGCGRCLKTGVPCKYPEPAQRRGPKRLKGSQSDLRSELLGVNAASTSQGLTEFGGTGSPIAGPDAASREQNDTSTKDPLHPTPSETDQSTEMLLDPADKFQASISGIGVTEVLDPVEEDSDLQLPLVPDLDPSLPVPDPDLANVNGMSSLDFDNLFEGLEMNGGSSNGDGAYALFEFHESSSRFPETGETSSSHQAQSPRPQGSSTPPSISTLPHLMNNIMPTPMHSTTAPTPPAPNQSCQCLVSVACLLEILSIEGAQSSLQTVGRLLLIMKRTLNHCDKLLDCATCTRLSYYVMLLIVLCQKTTASFGQVLVLLSEQFEQLQRVKLQAAQGGTESLQGVDAEIWKQQMLVLDYDLDAEEEPCVFGALTLTQLRRLRALLIRIRGVARQSHMVVIDRTEEQVRQLLKLSDKSSDTAP